MLQATPPWWFLSYGSFHCYLPSCTEWRALRLARAGPCRVVVYGSGLGSGGWSHCQTDAAGFHTHSGCSDWKAFPLRNKSTSWECSFFLYVHLYLPIKRKAWECLIAKVNFMFHNSPVHHCLSQHAGEIVCQMRNWHHQQCNTTGSRVTTGTIKSGWLWDVYSTDLIFDRGDERTVGCILGQSTTRFVCDWNSKRLKLWL